jgi:cytochrome c553
LKQLVDIKEKRRTVVEMTGLLDALTDQDLKDIAAYFSAQKITLGQANEELVKVGAPLYRAGNMANKVAACAACHGPTGSGIALAKYPALGGQHADYIAAQLHRFRKGERTNDGDTRIMRTIAAKLSDDEIKAVANYVSGLH